MAIFDEYKQAVQDVLDGNTKEPPRPFAFPDEQDMLAALYAAAAALSLSKEAPGGGGGVLVVHYENNALDKTWQEIHDAVVAGQFIVVQQENDDGIFWNYISSVESSSDYYSVMVFWSGSGATSELGTDSPTGYPADI